MIHTVLHTEPLKIAIEQVVSSELFSAERKHMLCSSVGRLCRATVIYAVLCAELYKTYTEQLMSSTLSSSDRKPVLYISIARHRGI